MVLTCVAISCESLYCQMTGPLLSLLHINQFNLSWLVLHELYVLITKIDRHLLLIVQHFFGQVTLNFTIVKLLDIYCLF